MLLNLLSRPVFFFLKKPGRWSSRIGVTTDKVNFRLGIRQNYFEKNQDIKSLCGATVR